MAYTRSKGDNLAVIMIVILTVTIAIIPIVKSLGGHIEGGSSQTGSVTQGNRELARLVAFANSTLERTISGDRTTGALPQSPNIFQTTAKTTVTDYGDPFAYDFELLGKDGAAKGNKSTIATLRIYKEPSDTKPLFKVTSYFADLAKTYNISAPPEGGGTGSGVGGTGIGTLRDIQPICTVMYKCTNFGIPGSQLSCSPIRTYPTGCKVGCSAYSWNSYNLNVYPELEFPNDCDSGLVNYPELSPDLTGSGTYFATTKAYNFFLGGSYTYGGSSPTRPVSRPSPLPAPTPASPEVQNLRDNLYRHCGDSCFTASAVPITTPPITGTPISEPIIKTPITRTPITPKVGVTDPIDPLLKEPTIPPELCYGCSPNGNGGKYPNN